MKMKQILAAMFAAAVMFAAPVAGFTEQVAKGIVTHVEAGKITVRDKHGHLTTIYIKPGDVVAIKVK